MDNKEVYSNIVNSIDLLNKSIILQDKNTVKLFSYLYNENIVLHDKINNLKLPNDDIKVLSYLIYDNIQKIDKLDSRISKIDKKIDKTINLINSINENILALSIKTNKETTEKTQKFKIYWNKIKSFVSEKYNICYGKCKFYYDILYRAIFYYKIKRKEEERKLREQEEERRRIELRNAKIKEILSNKDCKHK